MADVPIFSSLFSWITTNNNIRDFIANERGLANTIVLATDSNIVTDPMGIGSVTI